MRESCPFSALKGFNPVISIPPDIMHDCLKGIVPMVLKMVFVSLANNVSISFINAKIKEFLIWTK